VEIDLLREIKDIRDELNIILKVLSDQQMVLTAMATALEGLDEKLVPYGDDAERMFLQSHHMVDGNVREFTKMMTHADGAYEAVRDRDVFSDAQS
jgi:hypothetical protein